MPEKKLDPELVLEVISGFKPLVRAYLKENSYTMVEAALQTGLSLKTVQNICSDRPGAITTRTMTRLCEWMADK